MGTSSTPTTEIRERRLAAQISQEHLARLAGCSLKMVAKIERGYEPGFSKAGGKSRVMSRIEAALDEIERERAA